MFCYYLRSAKQVISSKTQKHMLPKERTHSCILQVLQKSSCELSIWVLPPLNHQYGEGNGTPFQYSCLENPMDGGAWCAADHGVTKGWTRLSDFTFTFHFHPLEKEMATHSSVLACRIPGTGSLVGCRLWGRTESDTTEVI